MLHGCTVRVQAEGLAHTSPGHRPGFAGSVCHCRPSACLITLGPSLVQAVQLNHPNQPYMPQSLSQVILHIVFSTKERRPWLDPQIRPRMHAYLATVCRDCGCEAYRVGGAADHVHLAARLVRTISQAELLEEIKKTSSAWMKRQGGQYAGFFWQGGYGAFSIGWSQLKELIGYIDRQEQHHRTQTFQQEYRDLLTEYHVEFDERYVWD